MQAVPPRPESFSFLATLSAEDEKALVEALIQPESDSLPADTQPAPGIAPGSRPSAFVPYIHRLMQPPHHSVSPLNGRVALTTPVSSQGPSDEQTLHAQIATDLSRLRISENEPELESLFPEYKEITFADGKIYKGHFLNGQPHGKGVCVFPNRDVYNGQFTNGSLTGRGNWLYRNGDHYQGEVVDGIRQGIGTFIFENGTLYQGNFTNGEAHGFGKCFYPNNESYVGQWSQGKKQGKGKYTYRDGSVYEGEFRNDLRHGNGQFKSSSGMTLTGNWTNDCFGNA